MRHLGGRRALRPSLIARWLVVVACAVVVAATLSRPVAAGLHNPIPADESGDPTDEFFDTDSVWAYVTSDIKGGSICVVAITASAGGSCDDLGTHIHREISIGTDFVLVANQLGAGMYRLMTTDSDDKNGELSQPFTVTRCTDQSCAAKFDDPIIAAWKEHAQDMLLGMDLTCLGLEAKDLIGQATAARGKIKDLLKRYHDFSTGEVGFVATIVPIGGGLVLDFDVPGFDNPGEEKAMEILTDLTCGLGEMFAEDAADPPDPNFTTVSQPQLSQLPTDQTASDTALMTSVDRQSAYGEAELAAYQRYQGAVAAGNTAYEHVQAAAAAAFGQKQVDELQQTIDDLRAEASALGTRPEFAGPVIANDQQRSDLASVYARVRSSGFTADETAQLQTLGYTSAQIADIRSHFDLDPSRLPVGETLQAQLSATADTLEAGVDAFQDFADDAATVAGRNDLAPVASFTATPASGLPPLQVQFADTSTSPDLDPVASVSWDFGDGGSGDGPSTSHTYSATGTYTVTETVSDGVLSATATRKIKVGVPNHPPVAVDDTVKTRSSTPLNIRPLANDSDPDGDPLFLAAPPPTAGHGTVTCDQTQCTYTPTSGFVGTDSFTYTATDGFDTDTGVVHITVFADSPPVAVDDSVGAKAGRALTVFPLLNDSDPDGDPLTIASQTPTAAHGTVTCLASSCTYTATVGYSGPDTFTYTITDGIATASAVVHVLVAANTPPVAVDDLLTTHGPEAHVGPLGNDKDGDGDPLTITSAAPTAAHGTVACDANTCTYTVHSGYTGTDAFSYVVSDGLDSSSAVVHVTAVADQTPIARDDSLSAPPGTGTVVFPLSNDSDPDDDALTIATPAPSAAHGSVVCTATYCTYTPTTGFTGLDSFGYTATDGAQSASATVHVAVGVDGPPVANDDSYTIPVNAIVAVNVLANDLDPEHETLRVTANTQPAHGGATCNTNGTCTYTPASGFHGTDSFQYTAGDGTQTDTAAVTFTVGVDRAPLPVDDTIDARSGVAKTFAPAGNDHDPDGDALSITTPAPAADHGTVVCDQFVCTYTSTAGFLGADSFQYTVTDGSLSATAEVYVTVTGNHPPTAVDDAAATRSGVPVSVQPLANDVDPDGDGLSITSSVPSAGHGTVACSSSSCEYTPAPGFFGGDTFDYAVSDGVATSTATVSVTVNPLSAAFTAHPGSGLQPLTVSFDASGSTDAGGTIVSYLWEFGDGASGSGETLQHRYDSAGIYTVTLTVRDGQGRTDTLTKQITALDASALQLPVCGDQDGSEQPFTFGTNCTEFAQSPDTQMYRVDGTGPVAVRFDWVYREAANANELEVFRVDDASGRIGTFEPGDPGYLAAAFARTQTVFPSGADAATPDVTLQFQGGDYLVFFIVTGQTLARLEQDNPTNSIDRYPLAFFSLDQLNPDGNDHMVGFGHDDGAYQQFAWEDLPGPGGDFNDIIFDVHARLTPLPPVVVTETADQPTAAAGTADGYTITVANSGEGDATLSSVADTLPTGFTYTAGSSSGATTADPNVAGRALTWKGPFTVPAGGSLTLHFGVHVAPAAGDYLSEATATAAAVDIAPTGPTAQVTVSGSANHAPVALAQSVSTAAGVGLPVTLGATDADGDRLSFAVVAGPAHGSLGAVVGGVVTYTPAAGYSGADSFTFKANDGLVDSNVATVSIQVTKVNHAPVALAQSVSTAAGVGLPVTLGASDADGDRLSFAVVAGPAHGSLGAVVGGVVTYTPAAGYSGADSFTFKANDGLVDSNVATVSIQVTAPGRAATTLTVKPATGDFADPTSVRAVLTNSATAAPEAGETVSFTLNGTETCSGKTDATGTATCLVTPGEASGSYPLSASFAGDAATALLGSSGSAAFIVTTEETALAYTGPTSAVDGQPLTLSARLTTDDPTDPTGIGGRTVTLALGGQSCSGTTNPAGNASCTVAAVTATPGTVAATAAFAGDAYFRPARVSASVDVFGPTAVGAFVLGDQTVSGAKTGTVVTFWGAQWAKSNKLSGGGAPASMKGFADHPTAIGCGATWTTRPGGSSDPPPTLPSRIYVVVASKVTKSGSTISGNVVHVVILQTRPGYGPDPGHAGTGTIVGTVC